MRRRPRRYDTAASRWDGLGPYYAMLPPAFADAVVGRYTRPAGVALDPFAGRRTALLSAAPRAPDYAIRWWAERGTKPPEVDPVEFLRPRLEWRYARGLPAAPGSSVYLGDSVRTLPGLARGRDEGPLASLLFTSPPYFGVT